MTTLSMSMKTATLRACCSALLSTAISGSRPTELGSTHLVAGDAPVHDRADAVARVLEGIAVVEGEVAVLADLDRAHARVDAEQLRGVDRDGRERRVGGQAVRRRHRRLVEHHARARHVAL